MRILIYGARGWIGAQFCDICSNQHVDFECANARADDETAVTLEIDQVRPTHVISFIGRTHGEGISTIDYLEQKGKVLDNIRDNLFAPVVLATACKSRHIHFSYLGTGCIFEYDEQHQVHGKGFTEHDSPNFFGSEYSVVKGYTDRLFRWTFPEALNLRIRMPITSCSSDRNFITKITTYDKICSMENSMTVLPSLLPVVLELMSRKTKGTINLCNPGSISHNEILEMYRDIVEPSFTWQNFSVEEQDQILKARRSNNLLDTSKLEKLTHVDDIRTAVRKALQNMMH